MTNKKVVLLISILSVTVLLLVVGLAVVLVAFNVRVKTTNVNVSYVCYGVSAEISARYHTVNTDVDYYLTEDMYVYGADGVTTDTVLTFEESEPAAGILSPKQDIEIENEFKQVVFEYKFANVGTKRAIKADLTGIPADLDGISVQYAVTYTTPITDFSELQLNTFEAVSEEDPIYTTLTINPGVTGYLYFVATVSSPVANLEGSFGWVLEPVDATTVQLNIRSDANFNIEGFPTEIYEGTTLAELPVPESWSGADVVFAGWYTDDTYTTRINEYAPVMAATLATDGGYNLYVKFLANPNLSVIYQEGDDGQEFTSIEFVESNQGATDTVDEYFVQYVTNALIIPDIYGVEKISPSISASVLEILADNPQITEIYIGNFVSSIPANFASTTDSNGNVTSSTNIINIHIGRGVTTIGDYAFAGSAITNVDLPKNVTTIGKGVFKDCTELTDVKISNTVTSLGEECFMNCTSLVNVKFEAFSKVTSLEDKTFYNCFSLERIVLPLKIENISHQVFVECLNLQEIYILNTEIYWEVGGARCSKFGEDVFYAPNYFDPEECAYHLIDADDYCGWLGIGQFEL